MRPERLKDPTPLHQDADIDVVRRERALALAVEDQVTDNGATVVLDSPRGAVLSYRPRVAHLFHAVATLLTAGLWAVVWILVTLSSRDRRVRFEADRWGNVWARSVTNA